MSSLEPSCRQDEASFRTAYPPLIRLNDWLARRHPLTAFLLLGGFSLAFGGSLVTLRASPSLTYLLVILPLWSAFHFSRRFSFALLAWVFAVTVWCRADAGAMAGVSHLLAVLLAFGGNILVLQMIHGMIDQNRRDLKAVEQLKEQYRIVADYSHSFEGWLDRTFRWRYLSPACEEISGYPLQAFLENPALLEQIVIPEDRPLVEELRRRAAAVPGKVQTIEHRIRRKDGGIRWVEHTCRLIHWREEQGEQSGWRISLSDITDEKLAKLALEESEQRYRELVEQQGEGLVVADEHQTFIFANPAAEMLLGVPAGSLAGRSLREFLPTESLKKVEEEVEKRRRLLTSVYELEIVRADGEQRTILITAVPYRSHRNKFIGTIATFRDITRRKARESRLEYESSHDMLTGVYNRAFLEKKLKELEADPPLPVSVLMMDVNDLKAANDSLGHQAGDQLLRQMAALLRNSLREADDIIARYGGDEFFVLLPRSDERAVRRVCERIRRAIEQENQSRQYPFQLDISIGAATCLNGCSLQQAIEQADRNMYRDKWKKKGRLASSSAPTVPLERNIQLPADAEQ